LKGKAGLHDFDVSEEIAGGLDGTGMDDFLGDVKKDQDSKVY